MQCYIITPWLQAATPSSILRSPPLSDVSLSLVLFIFPSSTPTTSAVYTISCIFFSFSSRWLLSSTSTQFTSLYIYIRFTCVRIVRSDISRFSFIRLRCAKIYIFLLFLLSYSRRHCPFVSMLSTHFSSKIPFFTNFLCFFLISLWLFILFCCSGAAVLLLVFRFGLIMLVRRFQIKMLCNFRFVSISSAQIAFHVLQTDSMYDDRLLSALARFTCQS